MTNNRMKTGFWDSVVMREFADRCVDKGWVVPSKIEKKASNRVASGDLLVDFSMLLEGMRERGFVRQADELEKKFSIYKAAERHLYKVHEDNSVEDMQQMAHGDDKVEIAEAESFYGDVLGDRKTKEKLMEVVRRSPSAEKRQKEAANAIMALSGMTKSAQEVAAFDTEVRKAVQNYNQSVRGKPRITAYNFKGLGNAAYQADSDLRNAYAAMAGISPDLINYYYKHYRTLFHLGVTEYETMLSALYNNPPEGVKNMTEAMNIISKVPGLGINMSAFNSAAQALLERYNESAVIDAIQDRFVLQEQRKMQIQARASNVANIVNDAFYKFYNLAWGNLDEATQKLQAELKRIFYGGGKKDSGAKKGSGARAYKPIPMTTNQPLTDVDVIKNTITTSLNQFRRDLNEPAVKAADAISAHLDVVAPTSYILDCITEGNKVLKTVGYETIKDDEAQNLGSLANRLKVTLNRLYRLKPNSLGKDSDSSKANYEAAKKDVDSILNALRNSSTAEDLIAQVRGANIPGLDNPTMDGIKGYLVESQAILDGLMPKSSS